MYYGREAPEDVGLGERNKGMGELLVVAWVPMNISLISVLECYTLL